MNHRVAVIVLVALFTTCFVGTGAIATLTVIKGIVNAAADDRLTAPEPATSEPDESTPPPEVPPPADDEELSTAEPTLPADEELLDEDAEADEYAPPLMGAAEFAVFHQEKAKVDPWVALQKAARGSKVKVFKGEAPASAIAPYLELRELATADYAVIGGKTLEAGRGLSPAVKAALPRAKRVSVIDAWMPLGPAPMLEVSKVMHTYALLTGGVMWDEETQEYFSPDAWKTRRLDTWEKGVPHASLHITVFSDGADKGLRTAGLKHFGLPELKIVNVPPESEDSALALLQAAAQIAVEDPDPPQPGLYPVRLQAMRHAAHKKALKALALPNAKGAVDLILSNHPGAKVPTLAVAFPGAGSGPEKLQAALAEFFGAED